MLQTAPARRPPDGVPVCEIDPFSLDFLRDPHPAHEALREAGPIVWLEKYGAYAAARHAEVRQILNDPVTFCSSRGVGLSDFQREKPWRPPSVVLERDPPEHDRARAVLNRALSATVMRSLRARFAEAADELAKKLARKARFDAVADCAEVYPMMVMPDAIGLSSQGREHLLPYAATVFNMFGPDNELRRAAVAQMAPHVEWIASQCKREALSDDGIGAAIHAGADAGEVTRAGGGTAGPVAAQRGFDTTVHGLGAAMRQLALNPDQFAALRADPSKARAAFEEAVRLETPVQTFFRTTTREVRDRRRDNSRGREGVDAAWRRQPRPAQMARRLTATTSIARPRATLASAAAFTCVWASCWRGWKARRCSARSRASSRASSQTASRRRL